MKVRVKTNYFMVPFPFFVVVVYIPNIQLLGGGGGGGTKQVFVHTFKSFNKVIKQ